MSASLAGWYAFQGERVINNRPPPPPPPPPPLPPPSKRPIQVLSLTLSEEVRLAFLILNGASICDVSWDGL